MASGEYELAPDSAWASRLHIARKPIQGEPKDGRFGLRVCHDLVQVNKTQVRAVANYPATIVQIEQAAGHRVFISTDAHSQFGLFELAEGQTRDCCALHWLYGCLASAKCVPRA